MRLAVACCDRLIVAVRVGLFYSLLIERRLSKSLAGAPAEIARVFEQDLSQKCHSRFVPEFVPDASGVRSAISNCRRRAGAAIL
jgi:hypothetical protein